MKTRKQEYGCERCKNIQENRNKGQFMVKKDIDCRKRYYEMQKNKNFL